MSERDRAVSRNLACTHLRIWAHDPDFFDAINLEEHGRHLLDHFRVGDTLFGLEHDVSAERTARAWEVLVEHRKASRAFRLGGGELTGERSADSTSNCVDAEQNDDPRSNNNFSATEGPTGQRGIHIRRQQLSFGGSHDGGTSYLTSVDRHSIPKHG